ncbi:hypothetical protein Pmani_038289, partial [Petrolisthes manimaculis]
ITSLTFANYLLQPFFPVGQEPPQLPLRFVAILLILTLTFINTKKVKWAIKVQDTLAVFKVFVLVVIILTGLYYLVTGNTSHFDNAFEDTNWNPTYFATAFYHTLYAYEGWDSLNGIMEEVKDPVRNMPRAITISLTIVITIYILTNVAFFTVLDSVQMLSSSAVAVTFGQLTLGAVAWVIPIFVACSTGGSLNGLTLAASRLIFVSARRGQLPKFLSYVHIKNNTPITALIFTASISMVMFMTSDVRVLINYFSFSGNLMGLLCISTFFYFRIKHPDMHRPIKVWIGFPIMYFIIGIFLTVFPAIRQPMEVVASLVVIATSLPVYYLAIHRKDKPKFFTRFMDKVAYYSQLLFLAVPEEKECRCQGKRQVLKAQQGINVKVPESTSDVPNASDERGDNESDTKGQVSSDLATLQQQLLEMTHARDYYYYEMYKKDTELTALQQQQSQEQEQVQQVVSTNEAKVESQQGRQNAADFFDSLSNPEMENLRKQLEDLQLVLYNKDSEIQQLKDTVSQTSVLTPPPDSQNGIQVKKICEENNEAYSINSLLEEENATLRQQIKEYGIHVKQLQTQLETSAAMAAAATAATMTKGTSADASALSRCKHLECELDCLKREQEDLLVLVTDQESKVAEYRRKLRSYGEEVTDDEDDEDGENFNLSDAYDDDLDELQ